jgi:ribosomal protein L9
VAHDLHVARKAGDSDMLYGSVTNADRTVQGDGFDVDRRKILLPSPCRQRGVVQVSVKPISQSS